MGSVAVGLFDHIQAADRVVSDLMAAGFRRDEISVVAAKDENSPNIGPVTGTDTEEHAGTGAVMGGIAGLFVGMVALAIPGIGPALAVGPLAAGLAGAGVGAAAGGMIGALTEMGASKEEAERYSEGIRRGAVLVTVRTDRTPDAAQIMNRDGAIDVEQRASEWKPVERSRKRRAGDEQDNLIPKPEPDSAQTGRTHSESGGARVFVW
jgi:hypothetical protein